jgi:hypothetical protein
MDILNKKRIGQMGPCMQLSKDAPMPNFRLVVFRVKEVIQMHHHGTGNMRQDNACVPLSWRMNRLIRNMVPVIGIIENKFAL